MLLGILLLTLLLIIKWLQAIMYDYMYSVRKMLKFLLSLIVIAVMAFISASFLLNLWMGAI